MSMLAQRGASPRLGEPLPVLRRREWDGAFRLPRPRPASERPSSIRDAIIRWLDQEL
ncbi:hypothetical protein [Myxococcus fulvus]|nr:hypothetical protein [Myxococcus fulvus]AKF82292.1 hypothetical protein MFUL124B02_26920 [Myxococcus fulvus 124B02]